MIEFAKSVLALEPDSAERFRVKFMPDGGRRKVQYRTGFLWADILGRQAHPADPPVRVTYPILTEANQAIQELLK